MLDDPSHKYLMAIANSPDREITRRPWSVRAAYVFATNGHILAARWLIAPDPDYEDAAALGYAVPATITEWITKPEGHSLRCEAPTLRKLFGGPSLRPKKKRFIKLGGYIYQAGLARILHKALARYSYDHPADHIRSARLTFAAPPKSSSAHIRGASLGDVVPAHWSRHTRSLR